MVGPRRLSAIINASFVGLLCLGVFLQMLGAPLSFWDLDGSDDDFVSSLLVGLAVPSTPPHDMSLHSYLSHRDRSAPAYRLLYENLLFHPPISA